MGSQAAASWVWLGTKGLWCQRSLWFEQPYSSTQLTAHSSMFVLKGLGLRLDPEKSRATPVWKDCGDECVPKQWTLGPWRAPLGQDGSQ